MILGAVVAIVLYTVCLGTIWPARDGASPAEFLLDAIAKSLLFSWLLVAASYFAGIPNVMPAMLLVALAVAGWNLWKRRAGVVFHASLAGWASLVIGAVLVFVCARYLLESASGGEYRLIFQTWDALVSWNRWAVELSHNDYNPGGGAYPLLFPGLWSLIYKAQGNVDVWIFAKLTLFILPAILGLLVMLLIERGRLVAAAVTGTFIVSFFFANHAFWMFNGNMDVPVAALMLVGGVMMYVSVTDLERGEQQFSMLLLSAAFTGLGAITKQAGTLMFVPMLLLLVVQLWRRRIGVAGAAITLGVAILPPLLFGAIYLPIRPTLVGNIEELQGITAAIVGTGDKFISAAKMVGTMQWPPLTLALFVGGCLNFLGTRRPSGWLGLAFLGMALLGFFIFANCCAYEPRNGWWTLSLLVASTLCGLANFTGVRPLAAGARAWRFPQAAVVIGLLAVASGMGVVAYMRLPDEKLLALQAALQWNIAPPEVQQLLQSSRPELGETGRYISAYQIIGQMPGFASLYARCDHIVPECVRAAIERFPGSFIFVDPNVPELTYADLKDEYLTPDNRRAVAGNFEIYGPF